AGHADAEAELERLGGLLGGQDVGAHLGAHEVVLEGARQDAVEQIFAGRRRVGLLARGGGVARSDAVGGGIGGCGSGGKESGRRGGRLASGGVGDGDGGAGGGCCGCGGGGIAGGRRVGGGGAGAELAGGTRGLGGAELIVAVAGEEDDGEGEERRAAQHGGAG